MRRGDHSQGPQQLARVVGRRLGVGRHPHRPPVTSVGRRDDLDPVPCEARSELLDQGVTVARRPGGVGLQVYADVPVLQSPAE